MSRSSDPLHFRFSTHGDSVLSQINALREDRRFCDITLLLGGPEGAAVQPLHFHGHRVVLAASSDFLRDQFLLHEGRAELSVGVVSSVEVGRRLLLSCYTGHLEVPLRELVSFLTAASALQMSRVVEKCAQAVSQYLGPTLAFLKLERESEEEIPQPNGLKNREERDVAQPSDGIQEANVERGGMVVIQARVSQGAEVESQGPRDDRRVVIAKIELSEGAACRVDTLESEESGDTQPHANNTSCQDHSITGAVRGELRLPTAVRDHVSSAATGREELDHSSQNQSEEAEEEQSGEEEMILLAAQLQECRQLTDSSLSAPSGVQRSKSRHRGDELTDESGGTSLQRPYLCRRCDRVFQHLESYAGHLKEHRQHLCLVCGKGFSQKSSLTHHIRVHTGVKPFRCPLCHKTFSQKAMLQDHFNLHTGDKPHVCNYCAGQFAHKPGLRRHLKDTHGKSSLQNELEEAVD